MLQLVKKIFIGLAFIGFANTSYALGSAESLSYDGGLRLDFGVRINQPIHKEQRADLLDGGRRGKSSYFNDKSPDFAGFLRFYKGSWFGEGYIGGPTSPDETVIHGFGSGRGTGYKVSSERTVYGGFKLGRDIFTINPFNPLDSFALVSSAESASYASSFAHQGLVFGAALGFRVVGHELELKIIDNFQGGKNIDDSIDVEPTAEIYARLPLEFFIVSLGVQAAMQEEKRVTQGFFSAETERDVDVNFFAEIAIPYDL
jgi:hypothetical protein